jgi:hypothetical protein
MLKIESMSPKEVALATGNDRQTIRSWLKTKKRSRIACEFVRSGLMTIDEYKTLEEGKSSYYNNFLFAVIFASHNLKPEGVAQLTNLTLKTVREVSRGRGSDASKKTIFYVAEKKLGIENAEELYNGTFADKAD